MADRKINLKLRSSIGILSRQLTVWLFSADATCVVEYIRLENQSEFNNSVLDFISVLQKYTH